MLGVVSKFELGVGTLEFLNLWVEKLSAKARQLLVAIRVHRSRRRPTEAVSGSISLAMHITCPVVVESKGAVEGVAALSSSSNLSFRSGSKPPSAAAFVRNSE